MPPWRASIKDQTVRQLDLLPGKPFVLAVWTQIGRVHFYDAQNGANLSEKTFDGTALTQRQDTAWGKFVDSLSAPNGAVLPLVRTTRGTIHSAAEGGMRLLHIDNELILSAGGRETKLDAEAETRFAAVALDRLLGLVAALDMGGRLHIYQQHIRVGIFDVGIKPNDEFPLTLNVSYGGTSIFVCDGVRLAVVDQGGKVRKSMTLHYPFGGMTCSPDGKLIAISDAEIGVIRVYNGATLSLMHQRFASDLMVEAKRAHAGAAMPAGRTTAGALALTDKGALAFAMLGAVCVSSISRMGKIPNGE